MTLTALVSSCKHLTQQPTDGLSPKLVHLGSQARPHAGVEQLLVLARLGEAGLVARKADEHNRVVKCRLNGLVGGQASGDERQEVARAVEEEAVRSGIGGGAREACDGRRDGGTDERELRAGH